MLRNFHSYQFCRSIIGQKSNFIKKDIKSSFVELLKEKDTSSKIKDSVFVRHAHSQFNRACQNYRLKHKIGYDWEALSKHEGFSQAVAYNPQYIDCPLTEVGVEQCYLTSHNLNLSAIDIILVSPHERALQTCDKILRFTKKHSNLPKKIPVIVEPLVAGSLWSSCDISNKLQPKMNVYKQFDFTKVMKLPQLWFIENLRDEDKRKIYNEIKVRKFRQFGDKQLLCLQMIRTQKVEQDREIIRKRAWQIKREMLRLKKKHCNILLISHYYIIQYINSRAFNQLDHKPLDDVDLKNCFPYYNNLEDLLNYR